MDHPFRISYYLRQLARRWKLILAPAIIALLAAVAFSFITPTRYTAHTTLIAPKPQLVWRWENKVYDIVNLRFDWRAEVIPLVKTQKVADAALTQAADQLSRTYSAAELMAATSVKEETGSLFSINVKLSNAEDAAHLANALALALPAAIADIYAGDQDAFAQAQAYAQQNFDAVDDQWRAFRAKNGIGLGFTGDLTSTGDETLYGNQSAIKQELTIRGSDVANSTLFLDKLSTVLAALEANEPNTHLALLDSSILARYGLNFEQLRQLSRPALQQTLQTLQQQLQSDVAVANADLLTLQDNVAQLLQQRDNLLRSRGVWYDSLKALQNKQIELETKRIVEGQRVQQVDAAQIPTRPSQPNWPLNLGLALIAGLLGGLLLAVIATYLGGEDTASF